MEWLVSELLQKDQPIQMPPDGERFAGYGSCDQIVSRENKKERRNNNYKHKKKQKEPKIRWEEGIDQRDHETAWLAAAWKGSASLVKDFCIFTVKVLITYLDLEESSTSRAEEPPRDIEGEGPDLPRTVSAIKHKRNGRPGLLEEVADLCPGVGELVEGYVGLQSELFGKDKKKTYGVVQVYDKPNGDGRSGSSHQEAYPGRRAVWAVGHWGQRKILGGLLLDRGQTALWGGYHL